MMWHATTDGRSTTPNTTSVAAVPPSVITLSEAERPSGLAMILSSEPGGGRFFLCDHHRHCLDVISSDTRPLVSIGGLGSAPGQFRGPADVALVSIEPDVDRITLDAGIVAVADFGNNRIQLFEPDGAFVGVIRASAPQSARPGWPALSGWPFFRVGIVPALTRPSRLAWRRPFLEVTTAGGVIARVCPATAVLPDFDTWLATVDACELGHALTYFGQAAHHAEVPADYLRRMAAVGGREGATHAPATRNPRPSPPAWTDARDGVASAQHAAVDLTRAAAGHPAGADTRAVDRVAAGEQHRGA